MPVLLFLASCAGPAVTGPTAMVGHIRSADGRPLVGVEVQSVEEPDRTDETGAFAVRYKSPSQFVHFTWQGLWYKRFYRDGDDGAVVDLTLFPTRTAALHCGQAHCEVRLTWEREDGLEVTAARACTPHLSHNLPVIPVGTPAVRCTVGSEARELELDDRGDALALLPPARTVRVELRVLDGTPTDCDVTVGDAPGQAAGERFWSARASGEVTVTASCDGRPARPLVLPAGEIRAALVWSGNGPWLDLEERAPWANEVVVIAESGEEAGWSMVRRATTDGRFALPPLTPGTYAIRVQGDPVPDTVELPPPGPPGVLVLSEVRGREALVGRLQIAADMLTGDVPIH